MVKIEELLESGVHLGHRVTKWNPKMAPFIFGERNGIHVIDLIQTAQYLNETLNFLQRFKSSAAQQSGNTKDPYSQMSGPQRSRQGFEGKSLEKSKTKEILFVGTKKQASSLVEVAANKINSVASTIQPISAHYVNHRWLGGLLTNWSTMKICIDHLNVLDDKEQRGELNLIPKKERSVLKKQHQKLNTYFGGIKKMSGLPHLVVIIGQDTEMNAVRECYKIQSRARLENDSFLKNESENRSKASEKMRTITLLDTNCDPSFADLFIPANDDSTKSIEFILNKLTDALI